MEMLEDENLDKELKTYLLLEIVESGNISLTKTKELGTETGIFSNHWTVLEAKATEIFEEKYTRRIP